MALIRLLASGVIAFVFYAAWAWYANSLVSSDTDLLTKAALVQGGYSGAMTLMFTGLLEFFYKQFGASTICLAFIAPRWSHHSQEHPCSTKVNIEHAVDSLAGKNGRSISGKLLVPLPALLIQSMMVIGINVYFETPNLWLTVLPSILFSGIYGYAYSLSLGRKAAQ